MRPPLAEALDLEPHPEGGWYRQTWVSPESVTLPDGRVIQPAKNTFLKYYEGAWSGRVLQVSNGSYVPDVYWYGTAAQTFDQLHVGRDVVGDAAPYLTENMDVELQLFEGNAISIEIPQRATFEIVDTEPVVKGQTASGSFKPALLSNGVKTMVPTHITAGTRVVVMTADGSYVERSKD